MGLQSRRVIVSDEQLTRVNVSYFLQELIDTNVQSERACCFTASESAELGPWSVWQKLPGTAAFTGLTENYNIIHSQDKLMKLAGSGNVLQKANSHLNMHEKGAQHDPHE